MRWRAAESLDLHLSVPWVSIRRSERGAPDLSLRGPGDAGVLAEWFPGRGGDPGPRGLSFLAGLKLPTGRPRRDLRVSPGAPPSLLQLGTGTTDALLGAGVRGEAGPISLTGRGLFQGTGGTGPNGLRPGNLLTVTAAAGARLTGRLAAGLAAEAFFRAPDRLRGVEVPFSGSSLLFATPSLSLRLGGGASLEASVRLPLDRRVNGTQLVPGPLYALGLALEF